MTLLSVVTPAYDMARFLPETLDSVAAVNVPHEHIVIDGASNDGTVELLEGREDPHLIWVSEADRGQTEAVNKGLRRAQGDLLAWLNADDSYVAEAAERAIAYLQGHPEVGAIFGGVNYVDEAGRTFRTLIPPRFSWRRYLYLGTWLTTPTVIFRRELLDRAGYLDQTWADAADYDFYLRLLRGVRVDRMDEPIVNFRYHPASKSESDVWTQLDEARAIRRRWVRNPIQVGVMEGWEATKRAILPRISNWPHPAPRGVVSALKRSGLRG